MLPQVFQEPQLQLVRQAQAGLVGAFRILGKTRPFLALFQWHIYHLAASELTFRTDSTNAGIYPAKTELTFRPQF